MYKRTRQPRGQLGPLLLLLLLGTFSMNVPAPPLPEVQGPISMEFSGSPLVYSILSWQFGSTKAVSNAGGGTGRDISAPAFDNLRVVRRMDEETAGLLEHAWSSGPISMVTLTQGDLRVRLKDAIITLYSVDGAAYGSEIPAEVIAFDYTAIDFTHVDSSVTTGWDLLTNTSCEGPCF